jgi:predicted ArsR family transcriptional regulator
MADGSAESRTRDRVRRAVGERGPVSARELASELGLTPAAVRRHLDALTDAGLIVEHDAPRARIGRGRGRPARTFVLTELGQEQLQTTYDGIATAALRFLGDHAGEDAVVAFAQEQIAELEERLVATVEAAGDDVAARTEALAAALSTEGFAAGTRPVGQGTGLTGIQLCQGHCPVRNVATEFRQICDAETDAFSRLLGVHVQRLATLAGGEHVCTTFVPTGALTSAIPTGLPNDNAVATTRATDSTPEGRSSR